MRKYLRLGSIKTWEHGRYASIHCKVLYADGALSITGVIGALPTGNCLGSCGQIQDDIAVNSIKLANGWTKPMLLEFLSVWNTWHLNDLHSGTVEQDACIKEHMKGSYHYDKAIAVLKEHNMYEVTLPDGSTYEYGSKWLFRAVPDSVVDFLSSLPEQDKPCAWSEYNA